MPSATAVEVVAFEGLTVDLARRHGAMAIVRGLRALSDFENELAIAHLNRKLAPEVDTVFFMTGVEHAYLSSSLVREIAAFGGDISAMVPGAVVRSFRGADDGALRRHADRRPCRPPRQRPAWATMPCRPRRPQEPVP